MISRKFISFTAIFVTLFTLITSSEQSTPSFDEENSLEGPDEPRSYCGLELKRAIRNYCREKIIESYRLRSVQRNFEKSSKCGENLVEKCCYHQSKCTISTFVQFCPYRYRHRRQATMKQKSESDWALTASVLGLDPFLHPLTSKEIFITLIMIVLNGWDDTCDLFNKNQENMVLIKVNQKILWKW